MGWDGLWGGESCGSEGAGTEKASERGLLVRSQYSVERTQRRSFTGLGVWVRLVSLGGGLGESSFLLGRISEKVAPGGSDCVGAGLI